LTRIGARARIADIRSGKRTGNECPPDREAISSRSVKELEERKMKKVNWTAVMIVTIVALLVIQVATSLLGGWGYNGSRYGGWGMMGPGMMGGMMFMWLFPLAFIVLTMFGIAWVVKAIGGGNIPPAPAHACPNCGRGAQADWKNCPHCGAALAK
jgi:uncharacterized membrane protein